MYYAPFTQLLWAKTREIGCGFVVKNKVRAYFIIIICNYGPGGNIYLEPVYEMGKHCSKCPVNTTCNNKYPGLCGKIELYIDENWATVSEFYFSIFF